MKSTHNAFCKWQRHCHNENRLITSMSSICGSTFLRRNYFLLPLFRLIDDTYFKIAKTNKQTASLNQHFSTSFPTQAKTKKTQKFKPHDLPRVHFKWSVFNDCIHTSVWTTNLRARFLVAKLKIFKILMSSWQLGLKQTDKI